MRPHAGAMRPVRPFEAPPAKQHVMLASDDLCEIYYRTRRVGRDSGMWIEGLAASWVHRAADGRSRQNGSGPVSDCHAQPLVPSFNATVS
jgi:hypothetical protein